MILTALVAFAAFLAGPPTCASVCGEHGGGGEAGEVPGVGVEDHMGVTEITERVVALVLGELMNSLTYCNRNPGFATTIKY